MERSQAQMMQHSVKLLDEQRDRPEGCVACFLPQMSRQAVPELIVEDDGSSVLAQIGHRQQVCACNQYLVENCVDILQSCVAPGPPLQYQSTHLQCRWIIWTH